MTAAEPVLPPSRLARLLEHPVTRLAMPLLIVAIRLHVLHKLATEVHWADITLSSWKTLGIAILWTALSFLAISFYDVLAVRSVAKSKIPDTIAGLVRASGSAISNFLGVSYPTGTAIRDRLYAALGLDLSSVSGVIATSWVAFWMGLTLLLGMLLTLHLSGLATVLPLDNSTETTIDVVLLLAIVGLCIWFSRDTRRLSIAGFGFALPGFRLADGLTIVAILDITAAAMTLCVLMPADLVQSYPYFFVVCIGAIAFGILSHAPAGRSHVLAALLLYRLICTLVPFLIAITGLASWRTILSIQGTAQLQAEAESGLGAQLSGQPGGLAAPRILYEMNVLISDGVVGLLKRGSTHDRKLYRPFGK